MSIVGPGAVKDEAVEIQATLDGASEYEFVTILNPLTDDFAAKVAQDIPVNMPFNIGRDPTGKTAQTTIDEQSAAQTYGLSLRNPDFKGRKHIENYVIIKAGQTLRVRGDNAQVVVRQLVNEIAQREGKKRLLADPTVRKEIEDRVIQDRGSMQDLMGNIQTPRKQIDEALNNSNEEEDEEFPELVRPVEGNATGSRDTGHSDTAPQKRAVGRPKKT